MTTVECTVIYVSRHEKVIRAHVVDSLPRLRTENMISVKTEISVFSPYWQAKMWIVGRTYRVSHRLPSPVTYVLDEVLIQHTYNTDAKWTKTGGHENGGLGWGQMPKHPPRLRDHHHDLSVTFANVDKRGIKSLWFSCKNTQVLFTTEHGCVKSKAQLTTAALVRCSQSSARVFVYEGQFGAVVHVT